MKTIHRVASRLLVLSPHDRALLLRLEPSFRDAFWVTPGGGIDEDETPEDAALRELREEVGRDDLPLGPCVWWQHTEFVWEDWLVRQDECHFVIRVDAEFEPITVDPDGEPIVGNAWLHPDEMDALREDVFPAGLSGFMRDLIHGGHPPRPIRLPDRRLRTRGRESRMR
jgi:8-oxo-dGTP pyrophosphatase MutT (NUDIX family)